MPPNTMVTLQSKTLTTHPRKVTLVTLGHMCGPTHPQVTKVTLFHVKRSLRAAAGPIPKKEIVDEVALYKSMPSEPMDVNILEWWPQHKPQFPFLSQMARQYLSALATSASCERVFSLAGRLFSDRQQNMSERSLEERMWAKVDVEMP